MKKIISNIITNGKLFTAFLTFILLVGITLDIKADTTTTQIALSVADGTNSSQATLAFNANSTTGYNTNYDATQFSSGAVLLYFPVTGNKLALYTVPPVLVASVATFSVPLVVASTISVPTSMTITCMAITATDYNYFLYDAYTGNSTLLTNGASYGFSITSDTSTSSANRFTIVTTLVTGITSAPASFGSPYMALSPNPYISGMLDVALSGVQGNQMDIVVTDTKGVSVYSRSGLLMSGSSNGSVTSLDLSSTGLPSGVYAVKCTSGGAAFTQMLVVAR